MRRGHAARVRAGAGAFRLQLLIAKVIAVHVGEQHHVDRAEPRIVAAGHVVRGVVQEAHAGRIFEDDRAVVRAEFSGMGADRCDFHVLGERRQCGERQGKCCAGELHLVPPPELRAGRADIRFE
jgi:hypothetical protein